MCVTLHFLFWPFADLVLIFIVPPLKIAIESMDNNEFKSIFNIFFVFFAFIFGRQFYVSVLEQEPAKKQNVK